MTEGRKKLGEQTLRDLFPWLVLFDSFRLALSFRTAVLSVCGVMLTATGWWLLAISFAPSVSDDNHELIRLTSEVGTWPWQHEYWSSSPYSSPDSQDGLPHRLEIAKGLFQTPTASFERILRTHWNLALKPLIDLSRPCRSLFNGSDFLSSVFAFLCVLWAILVWSFFGGAVSRIVAVRFSKECGPATHGFQSTPGFRDALGFARDKYLSFLGAPILVVFLVLALMLACVVGGSVSRIPVVGPIFLGLVELLPILASVIVFIGLVALGAGWPLMFATISVEGSDTFDAMSRSIAYTLQRPWRFLFYVLTATAFGALSLFFIMFCLDVVMYLTFSNLESGAGEDMVASLRAFAPPASGWGDASAEPEGAIQTTGAVLSSIWLYAIFLFVLGLIYSYFWSASTVIYNLLRHDVDGIDIGEVYIESPDEEVLEEAQNVMSVPTE